MSNRRFSRGSGGGDGAGGGNGAGGNAPDFGSWDEGSEQKPKRDLKKTFLVAGLAILSWVATYVGMLELIEANMGDLPIVHKVIIGFSVAMLMTMVVWLLDQLFQPIGFLTRLAYTGGYIFLSIISIGFGFGFYWKVLESRGEGTRGAEMAIASVQAPLQTAAARLESLQTTLVKLKDMSQQKAEIERTSGTSCPNSKPGDGPRRKLRDDDAGRFSFASDFVKGRIGQVKEDMASIEGDLTRIVKDDKGIVDKQGTRNEFMKGMNRKLDGTVTNFNAFRGDPQLKQIRVELAERAEKSQFIDTQGKPYSCPDQQLATMIRSVVASIDALPVLDKPKITTVEGSDATIEAFRRLTTTFYGLLSFKLPPSSDELRELQKRAMTQAEAGIAGRPTAAAMEQVGQGGLSKRDYVPLAIAIFVDICLLLVSMGKAKSRLQGLLPKMKEAERGPVIQILSRFNEIHKDRQVRENFEIFRHVVFDLNGDYYAAIPLIAPYSVDRRRPNSYGPADVEALQQEAHLLANFFTSFEREKLFNRVMMPLIPTSRIQKKLWAQGSKFAHAEAFRLYKFRDGAWQDMILGAIMGAAKRAETEKRLRRSESEQRYSPSFGRPADELPATDLQAHAASAQAMHSAARDAERSAGPMDLPFPQDFGGGTEAFAPGVPRPGSAGRPVAPPPPPAPPAETQRPASFRRQAMPEPLQAAAGFAAARRFRADAGSETEVRIDPPRTQIAEPAAANSNTATAEALMPIAFADERKTVALQPETDERHTVEFTERSVTVHMKPEAFSSLGAQLAAMAPKSAELHAATDVPEQPLLESKASESQAQESQGMFDAIDAFTLEQEQASTLGGNVAEDATAWDRPLPFSDRDDAVTIAQRFGLKQRA